MLGSELAADTMTYQSQMIISLTCIVRYNAHIEMNGSYREPMRQEQREGKIKGIR